VFIARGLAEMSARVPERHREHQPPLGFADVHLFNPAGMWPNDPLLDLDPVDMRRIRHVIPRLGWQASDDLLRPSPHGSAIRTQRHRVHPGTKLDHFVVGHPRAHIAACQVQARCPAVPGQGIWAIGDQAIDPHVLTTGHVPEQPGNGVQVWMGAEPHLVIGQLIEAVRDLRIHGLVRGQEE
jgi:hypothetical protein